jgi:hypothetical protein
MLDTAKMNLPFTFKVIKRQILQPDLMDLSLGAWAFTDAMPL